jgi:hypothetical protein
MVVMVGKARDAAAAAISIGAADTLAAGQAYRIPMFPLLARPACRFADAPWCLWSDGGFLIFSSEKNHFSVLPATSLTERDLHAVTHSLLCEPGPELLRGPRSAQGPHLQNLSASIKPCSGRLR